MVFSYLLMIPLINIGMVTGKTERQTASWLKSATAVKRSAAVKLFSSKKVKKRLLS